MNDEKITLQFEEKSNLAISTLVQICYSNLKLHQQDTLVTKPLENIYQSQYQAIDDQIQYPEPEDDISTIGPPILAYPFAQTKHPIKNLVIAVDSGIVPLGQLMGGGIAFALRGSAVIYNSEQGTDKNILMVLLYNSGVIIVNNQNKGPIFRYVGERLGKPDLYVRRNNGRLV